MAGGLFPVRVKGVYSVVAKVALRDHSWIRVAALGVVYFALGYGSTLFDQPFSGLHFWRLAAWVASVVVYLAHLVYEHFQLRNSPITTSIHVSLAVAIGGFLLAV